jgi:hypothetical protein
MQFGLAKVPLDVAVGTDQEPVVGQSDRVALDVAGRHAARRECRAVAVIDERESVRNPEVKVSCGGLFSRELDSPATVMAACINAARTLGVDICSSYPC